MSKFYPVLFFIRAIKSLAQLISRVYKNIYEKAVVISTGILTKCRGKTLKRGLQRRSQIVVSMNSFSVE